MVASCSELETTAERQICSRVGDVDIEANYSTLTTYYHQYIYHYHHYRDNNNSISY